ncbi:MAG: poly(A) polymerase [Solirubrobacteraceae bacterium]|nr:poly(A) polymerase [Solirubrobacteraceae bacterium]
MSADALKLARESLAGEAAWLVGGAVRDRMLGRTTNDVDLIVDGDVPAAARALGRAARGPAFELSDEFGAWRVIASDRSWQADLSPLRADTLEGDLALRDFTINAIAEPLAGGERVDPHGGAADLTARRLRAVGASSFTEDPLRALRLVRLAGELHFAPESGTIALARAHAPALARTAQERVFTELKRIVGGDEPVAGLRLMDELGLTAVVLPELDALRGLEQNHYHHADVHRHTIEVLEQTVALQADPSATLGEEHAGAVRELLAEPLADELDRAAAMRFGALLHDAAKPATLGHREDGAPTFYGHDRAGAQLARDVLTRLRASEKLKVHVAALVRHHLRLGFLVHERPLARRALYRYLTTCAPVEVDVTLLSVADRLATRGRKAQEAITSHVEIAREVLPAALRWRAEGPRAPLVAGDRLAAALGIAPGPELGRLLAEIDEARYAGEVSTREQAVALATRLHEDAAVL